MSTLLSGHVDSAQACTTYQNYNQSELDDIAVRTETCGIMAFVI